MNRCIIFVCAITLLIPMPANAKGNADSELLEIDKKLSAEAEKQGILNAFYPYLTDRSALFPEKGHPVMGKSACAQLLKTGITDLKRKWEPLLAGVSKAGDFGFTHGRFTVPDKKDNKKKHRIYYQTIWNKQKGKWHILVSQALLTYSSLNQNVIDTQYVTDIKTADKVTRELMQAELAFSAYSGEHGISEAFHKYIADDGLVIGRTGAPATKEKYAADIAKAKGKKYNGPRLQWSPFFSWVSASGDMGCNYGPYILTFFRKEGKPQKSYGYFITVWKKQPDNSWKFLLDGGNSTPGPGPLL